MRSAKNTLGACALLATLTLCSCSSERPQQNITASRAYNVPARQLVEALPNALAAEPMKLGVAKEQNGTVQTTWKEDYRGTFHIARYWQERTRFEVSIIPDWQSPQSASRLDIREETQERSNSRAEWRHNPDVARPDRAFELLKQLESQLSAKAIASAAASPAPSPVAAVPQAAPGAPVQLPEAQPAAATFDTKLGSGTLSMPVALSAAAATIEAECKAASLPLLYQHVTDKQAIYQVRKGNGPVVTIVAEARPGNLTRITVRQPAADIDSTAATLFQQFQAKRPAR